MSISSLPAKAGHPLSNVVVALRARFVQWRHERGRRITEKRAIALLQRIEPGVLVDIGAAGCPVEGSQPSPNGSGRTEVGPMLAAYLPYSGRSTVNDARERWQ